MAERNQNYRIPSKISTLEDCLNRFNMPCLLEQLDMNLELVRTNNKETKEKLDDLLKSVDKDLLKLSQVYHPDKAIGQKKPDEEVAEAQNLQTALNATRNVLKALTEAFLKDIDVHYKYEYFAKLNINTLTNEEQIDLEISNVLCRISRLSEIKRVNIVGETRKFLQESRECLKNYLQGSNHGFARHRNHALRYLHKCIEGYKKLVTECSLIVKECSAAGDESTRRAMQKISEESLKGLQLLLHLEMVAESSLDGTFEIFPIYEPKYCAFRDEKPVVYKPAIPKELEYFVSPFVYYVDVLLMCSVMVDKKSHWEKLKTKMEDAFYSIMGVETAAPISFFKEPALLNAYHLVSYFINKNHYRKEIRLILENQFRCGAEANIRGAFKDNVKIIKRILAEQFDIESYKKGKSDWEKFNERLFELKNSMAEIKEEENNLLEKMELFERESKEIQKQYSKTIFERSEHTYQKCQENAPKNDNSRECIETDATNYTKQHGKTKNQTKQMADDQHHDSYGEYDGSSKEKSEDTRGFGRCQLNKESLSGQMCQHVYDELQKAQPSIIASSQSPTSSLESKTESQIAQITMYQHHGFFREHGESSKKQAEETRGFGRYRVNEESSNGQWYEHISKEPAQTIKKKSYNYFLSYFSYPSE